MAEVVKLEGLSEVQKRFNNIQKRMQKPNTVLDLAAAKGWRNVIKHFRDERGPDGKWKDTKEAVGFGSATLQRKPKKKQNLKKSDKLLQDTGRLRMSNRWRVLGNKAEVYNNTVYAATHNYGDTRNIKVFGKKTVKATWPQREFMWLDDKTIDSIVKIFIKYLWK
jgi:phage gpG-like protein